MNDPFKTQVGGGHYKDLPIQPVEFCQRNKLGYCESSAIKYLARHRSKNGKQDLEKAVHFIQLLIEMEYPEKEKTVPAQVQVEPVATTRTFCGWVFRSGVWTGGCGFQHSDSYHTPPAVCPKCQLNTVRL